MIKKRVLIVDDTPELNRMIAKLLKEVGFLTKSAFNYEEAKTILEKEVFDLVTLDMDLKDGHTGLDLLPFLGNAKAVLISGSSRYELAAAVQKYEELSDFISKPFRGEELVSKAYSLLDVR